MKYEVKVFKDLPYREGAVLEGPGSQTLDLFVPQGAESFPVLVFLHGGGFMHYNYSKETYVSYCMSVAESGVAVAAPNYRLYPEFPGQPSEINEHYCDDPEGIFNGFMDDAACASAWVRDHLGEYGPYSGSMFLGGHSAGAWQSMMLLFNGRYLEKYGIDSAGLKGCIFASGQPTSHFSILFARGMDPRLTIIDDAAPMYYFKSLPVPQLVTMAENDMPGRALQTQLYLAGLGTVGYEGNVEYVEYRGHGHNNYVVPDAKAPNVPCALYYDTVKFIRRYE